MNHAGLSAVRKVVGSLLLLLVQVVIVGFVVYLALGFLLSLAEALLGFWGIMEPSFWLKVLVLIATFAGFVLVLMVMIILVVLRVTGDLPKTANAFFRRVASGDLSGAYQLTSEEFQGRVSMSDFLPFAEAKLLPYLGHYKKSVWSSRSIQNESGLLQGVVYTRIGGRSQVEVHLVRERGIWKIHILAIAPWGTPFGTTTSLPATGGVTDPRTSAQTSAPTSAPLLAPFPATRTQTAPDVPQDVQNRLIGMMAGDRPAVQRLLNQARSRYPGQSEVWYWEKVTADLERDRSS